MAEPNSKRPALGGLKVVDVADFFAAPLVATLMADFGADVIKVEDPAGDPVRRLEYQKDGVSMWWLLFSRNKRCVTLNLRTEKGQDLLKELVARADLLVENFPPGTMDGWGLGYEALHAITPRLVYLSTSNFGQTGPYRDRPGSRTVGEAMSGFGHLTGERNGPPQLPPFAPADHVAGVFGTIGAMVALYHRDVLGSGKGQHIDVSRYEPMLSLCGPQAPIFDLSNIIATRSGNRMATTAPRNNYMAKDGSWVAVSSASLVSASRMLNGVGRPDIAEQPWFQTSEGRVAHVEEIDAAVGGWIGQHTRDEVISTFEQFEAVAAPIYNIADMFADPQFVARESITTVEDARFGPVRIQSVAPRLSKTPGEIRHLGPGLGEHNWEIYVQQLGHSEDELAAWQREGII